MSDPSSSSRSSPTGPVAIPIPVQQSYFQDSSHFVGSPEQASDQQFSRPHTSIGALPSSDYSRRDTRPSFRRTVSSASATQGGASVSRMHEFASGLFRGSRSDRPKEREWTVFGQLMAHEDRRRPVSASVPRTPGTLHSATVSSPRALSDVASSYFDYVAPNVGGSSLHEGERASTHQNGQSGGDVPSGYAETTSDRDSSEDSSTHSERIHRRSSSKWKFLFRLPELSLLHRNIIKCCIAYFIASLFTFSPYLSGFIADITGDNPGERIPSPSGHMVATMYVSSSLPLPARTDVLVPMQRGILQPSQDIRGHGGSRCFLLNGSRLRSIFIPE